MPTERKRETDRQWQIANRERRNAQQRARRAADRERRNALDRAYRAANREHVRAKAKERYWADPDRARASQRRGAATVRHGRGIDEWIAATLEAQDGRCYLCGDALVLEVAPRGKAKTHVDHDHRCCPRNKSCTFCRRGLSCGRCNVLIGIADDDPALLVKIAGNLARALGEVAARLESRPEQGLLAGL